MRVSMVTQQPFFFVSTFWTFWFFFIAPISGRMRTIFIFSLKTYGGMAMHMPHIRSRAPSNLLTKQAPANGFKRILKDEQSSFKTLMPLTKFYG